MMYLWLYEFFRYWRIERAHHLTTSYDPAQEASLEFHARLTPAGRKEVQAPSGDRAEDALKFVEDYVIKDDLEDLNHEWVPFPNVPGMENPTRVGTRS